MENFSFFHNPPFFEEKNEAGLKEFFVTLVKSTGLFFLMSFVIFFVVNYQFIKSQIADWKSSEPRAALADFNSDSNKNNLPDWWESQYGVPGGLGSWKDDPDADQANNLVECQFGTDPTNPDSDSDGYSDGNEIRRGYDPASIGRQDNDGDGIYSWWEKKFGFSDTDPEDIFLDGDNDGLSNLGEFQNQTDPRDPDSNKNGIKDGQEAKNDKNQMGIFLPEEENLPDKDQDGLDIFYEDIFGCDPGKADTDGDGYSDLEEIIKGDDPNGSGKIAGRIKIPAISLVSPIVWVGKEGGEGELRNGLERGVVHYPGTAFPGMPGNAHLAGHSSYYVSVQSPYKEVFEELPKLKKGEEIIVELDFSSGRKVSFIFRVSFSGQTSIYDNRLFRDFEGTEITLSTGWPIGTDWKRWMVKAELEKAEF
jgi:sortase (surface protein transpeptidase)